MNVCNIMKVLMVIVLSVVFMFVYVTGSEFVYVSKALQKAKIEVNEDGTKASAATSKILRHKCF